MNILVDGPQCSGKSTQAAMLAFKLKVPHIQMGEILRNISLINDSKTVEVIKEAMNEGELVPLEINATLVNKRLRLNDCKNGFVLDGFPRNDQQLERLESKLDKVFYLKISDEEGIKRLLLRKRADDNEETIKQRLSIYHSQTEPVLEIFRQDGILEEIDGERSIEEIHTDILERVKQ